MNEFENNVDPNEIPLDNEEGFQTLEALDPNLSEEEKIAIEYNIDPSFITRHEDGSLIIADPITGNVFMSDDDAENSFENTENDTPVAFVNKLDEVLRKSGYNVSEIDFGDGNIKPISELSDEEQIDILVQQLLSKQEESTPLPSLSPDETKLVEFLRSGKSPRELAESILESDLSYKYSKMSDEEVVREYLTKEKPTFTPEEIEEEIEDMKGRGTKLAREAKDIRTKFSSTAQLPQVEPDVDFEKEKADLITYATNVQVPAQVKNDVLNFILPKNSIEESELIKYMSTPDALFNVGYLLTQFDNISKQHQQELIKAEEKGRKIALGLL